MTTTRYTPEHEWLRIEADGLVTVGITDFAQSELGDIMFIDLPEIGRTVAYQEQIAVVESVKAASDLFSPVSGTVIAVNNAVQDEPELVNENAFATWLFCIKADNLDELAQLMNVDAYQQMIGQ